MVKLRIILITAILYAITLALGLTTAWQHIVQPNVDTLVSPLAFSWADIVVFIFAMATFTFVMVRSARVAKVSLSFLMMAALLGGTQFIFSSWFGWPASGLAALAVVATMMLVPIVAVHDAAIILGIAGIAAVLGLSLTPITSVVLLAVLSIYDIISVYRTKHMVQLAGRMIQSGAVLGFLVPARLGVFLHHRRRALGERSVLLLGSGDIGLPIVLMVSTVSQSIPAALFVAGGALLGVLLMQIIFMHQRHPAPMAALPPIALMSTLGYIVAILLNV